MCYDVRHAGVILLGDGLGYWRVSGGGVLARLQRFYLGIWSVHHLGGCF
jgi:hypothetical protein